MRNLELKARDPDPPATLAAALSAGAEDRGVLHQVDTYFDVPHGRLKLREEDGRATLIPYRRADAAQARESRYELVDVPDPAALTAALRGALGVEVVVEKRRHLLMLENVRIHLDEVTGLGSWVEIEAVVPDGGELEHERSRVASLRERLGITDERIVAEGYAQLLRRAGASSGIAGAAVAAMERAYAPYSQFRVGAALRDEAGTIHVAANVENAAYPQGQCAEASAIGVLVAAGGTAVTEVAVAADTALITPCGGCRQRLREFASPDTPVHLCGPDGVRRTLTLDQLLPYSFTAESSAGASDRLGENSPGVPSRGGAAA